MTNQLASMSECSRCRQPLPAGETRCPRCGALMRTDELTPLGGPAPPPPPPTPRPDWSPAEEQERLHRSEPVGRAPGQDAPGSWGYIKYIAKQDPLFVVVLGLLAVDVLVNLVTSDMLGAIISGAVFWGVYTFQSYGFWLAVLGSGLGVLTSLAFFSVAPIQAAIGGAISLFTVVVLCLRREYFR